MLATAAVTGCASSQSSAGSGTPSSTVPIELATCGVAPKASGPDADRMVLTPLTRRGHAVEYTLREVSPDEAGPVLKRYVTLAKVTRPYFRAHPDAPAPDFAAEADRHPVFELIATGNRQ
jgi:hypothetical protein